MREIALHILDIAQNSVRAGASLIQIAVLVDTENDVLRASVCDNGSGMTESIRKLAQDPFFTSRDDKKAGLGIPLFKSGALMCDGSFSLNSKLGKGTAVTAEYRLSHIDRPPLGDMAETILSIIACDKEIDVCFTFTVDNESFTFNTREVRNILGNGIPLNAPHILSWIREYIIEGIEEIDQHFNGGVSL